MSTFDVSAAGSQAVVSSKNSGNGGVSCTTTSRTSVSSSSGRYKCHLCSFETESLDELHVHMPTHFNNKCPFCDYTSRTEGRLKHHVANFHSATPPDSWAGGSSSSRSQPKRLSSSGDLSSDNISGNMSDQSNNGQADDLSLGGQQCSSSGMGHCKPRKHRCKQCAFVAMNKEDFWEHTKQHIKEDKRLNCPQCPFVTEFKHHLEYHLRNHLGSKPFKCEKCNYSCVNKSMLNSHLKSHSNIYQYRCDDCAYATKYCHSLKLHLRKYAHKPATVLTLDGSPNPNSIIDVYGTRRGPRPKKSHAAADGRRRNHQEDRVAGGGGCSGSDRSLVDSTDESSNCNRNQDSPAAAADLSLALANVKVAANAALMPPQAAQSPINGSNGQQQAVAAAAAAAASAMAQFRHLNQLAQSSPQMFGPDAAAGSMGHGMGPRVIPTPVGFFFIPFPGLVPPALFAGGSGGNASRHFLNHQPDDDEDEDRGMEADEEEEEEDERLRTAEEKFCHAASSSFSSPAPTTTATVTTSGTTVPITSLSPLDLSRKSSSNSSIAARKSAIMQRIHRY